MLEFLEMPINKTKNNNQMKKSTLICLTAILIIGCQLSTINCYAQPQLLGMTQAGGQDDLGLIFKTDSAANSLTVQQSFLVSNQGANPMYTNLIQATDGMLYGMTNQGGANNIGLIFQYNPATNIYIKKIDLNAADGSNPRGSLMQATDGMLYGMTSQGGVNAAGVIFQYNPATNIYIKKLDFDATNGGNPSGSLMQATDGMLYGMTSFGGTDGVIFQYDPATNIYIKKIDLNGADGSDPRGSLMQASDGMLYGMTRGGGANYYGVIFQYDPATNIYTKKIDLDYSIGAIPEGSLMQATDGMLYGMTQAGGGGGMGMGVLFQYDPAANTYTQKIDLDYPIGTSPHGSLIQATDGKLYGTTGYGGVPGDGVIFQYDPSANTYIKKFNFDGAANGSQPWGSLMQASDGMLYGMTHMGGGGSAGVIFQYNPSADTYTKKIDFLSPADGGTPYGSLMQASDGKLYGMTNKGGANVAGVIFQYDSGTNTYTKKVDLSTANGSTPFGSLMQATDGKLYGMTNKGGANDVGVIFQYDPATNIYIKKLDFDFNNGANPYGSLMQATDGMLYGMTNLGGANGVGVLFQYNPATNTYTTKFDFDLNSGQKPFGSLMQASDGKLYGMTADGGGGSGVLFQYDPATNTYTKKLNFYLANGKNPYGSLMQASDGKLYGMTVTGGANNLGVLFQYNINTNTYTKKLDFNGATNGSNPAGSLMQASDGKLYGMTNTGGANNFGVLFQYNTTTNTYTQKLDFNGTNGKSPFLSNLIDITVSLATSAVSTSNCAGSSISVPFINTGLYTTGNVFSAQLSDASGSFASPTSIGTLTSITAAGTINALIPSSTPLGTGYKIRVVSSSPAITGSDNGSNISINAMLTVTASASPAFAVCTGDSVTLTGGGALTYVWTGGIADGVGFVPSSTAIYTVTGTDGNGCTNTVTKTITVNPLPTVFAFATSTTVCAGTSVTLYGVGNAISYAWTDGVTDGLAFVPDSTNTYTVIGTDGNGCSSIASKTITVLQTSPCSITSIGNFENSFATTVNIYPNPFTTQTTIAFDNEQKNTLVKIMDVLGKEIKTVNFTGKALIVEKEEMQAGIYFVQIYAEQGIVSKKIIIN